MLMLGKLMKAKEIKSILVLFDMASLYFDRRLSYSHNLSHFWPLVKPSGGLLTRFFINYLRLHSQSLPVKR